MLQQSEPSFKKWIEVTAKKKGYKQIFIPVTVGLRKPFSDII